MTLLSRRGTVKLYLTETAINGNKDFERIFERLEARQANNKRILCIPISFILLLNAAKQYRKFPDLEFASECSAECSKHLRTTKLRKHITTMSELLNLNENEIDILADYLGQDIRVHREFY